MSAATEDQRHPKNDLNKLWEEAVKEFNAMQSAQREADLQKLKRRRRYLACLKKLDCFSPTEKAHDGSPGHMSEDIQTIPKPEQVSPEKLREDLASSVKGKDVSDDSKDVPNLAREILGSVLELGGFAVKIAASFWEPAELCYTAFHWLVDTVKRYDHYFSGIKELLDEIKKPLGRFVVLARRIPSFAEKGDPELQSILHRLLSTFVWICSHATSLLRAGSREKLKIAAMVALIRDDGGIQKNLNVIRELADEEKYLLPWLSYTTVKSLEGSNTSDKNRERIQQALCIPKGEQIWWDTYLQIQRDLVKHTGSWLLNREEMSKWCGESASGEPILALEGSQASGKTYLCSRVINRLQEKFPSSTLSYHGRASSAYFYLVNMTKSDDSQLFKAITAIIWQLAEQDELFQQHVIRRIGSTGTVRIPNPLTKTFWWEMLAEYKPKTKTRYFLVLDGFDRSRDNDLWRRIVKDVCALNDQEERSLYIRLLLTGSKSFLDEVLEGHSTSVPRLLIDGANDDDVRLYLEHGVREAYRHGNTDCNGVLSEVQKLLPQLPRDYVKLKELKKGIKQQDHEEGIKRLLQDATKAESRKYDTKSLLEKLEKSLPGDRICDLNEMLPWIVLPDRWPTTEEIETVLVLRTEKTSIRSLENIINNEYPADLFTIDGDTLRSKILLDYFNGEIGDPAEDKSIKEKVTTSLPAEDGLHKSEVAIIHALVKSVCPDDLWQRLRLKEFLESKLSSPPVVGLRITYSHVDAHVKIIMSCLESFRYARGKPLHEYGVENLAHHLQSITDVQLSQIDSDTRKRIGDWIYGLLMDKGCIRRWLNPDLGMGRLARRHWLYRDNFVKGVARWLKDAKVYQGAVQASEKDHGNSDWPKKALEACDNNNNGREVFFRRATNLVADEWLEGNNWDVSDAVLWLVGFLTQSRGINSPRVDDDQVVDLQQSDWYRNDLRLHEIREARKWAKQELKHSQIEGMDTRSNTRYAQALLAFDYAEEAIQICQTVLQDGQDWRATWCMAQAQFQNGDKTAGDETVQSLVDGLCSGSLATEADAREWKLVVKSFAERGESANLEKAIKATEVLRQTSPTDLELLKMLIDLMAQGSQATEDLVGLLRKVASTAEHPESSETLVLRDLFLKYASDRGFHSDIANAAWQRDGFDILNTTYAEAMEGLATSTSEDTNSKLGSLRYFYATFLFYYGDGKDQMRQAMKLWKTNISDSSAELFTRSKSGSKFVTAQLQSCEELRKSQQPAWEDQITKLEKLIQDKDCQWFLARHEAYKIARFYQNANQRQKVVDYLRPYVQTAMLYLTDDDSQNDWQGYKKLAEALTYVDEPNAIAAWSLIRSEEGEDGMDEILSTNGPLSYSCDGGCRHQWTYPNGMNYCQECTDVQMDSACLEKLRNGELRGVCGATHTFLAIPSWNPTTAPKEGHVRVSGQEMSIQDWLRMIQKKYGLIGT